MGASRPKGWKRGGRRGTARGPKCLARHAGRLGVGTARGGAGPLADATPAPDQRAGTGPTLRAGVPAGAGPRRRAGDSLPRSTCRGGGERVAGGRHTAFPQGAPSWQGARSLGGARQVLVTGSWEQQRGGSPVAGRADWRPESGRAGWCGTRGGRRPRRAECEWGLTDWRRDD